MPPFAQLISVIVACGVLGGLSSMLMATSEEQGSRSGRIVQGIVAALATPLFLTLVGSGDVATFLSEGTDTGRLVSLLRIIGFCLVAAVFSSKFMASLSGRVFALEKKLDEVEETAQSAHDTAETLEDIVVESETTIDPMSESSVQGIEADVLKQLASGIPARSVQGIAISLKKTNEQIEGALRSLMKAGLASPIETSRGQRWKLGAPHPTAS